MGPLVAQRQQRRVRDYIDTGEREGARLVARRHRTCPRASTAAGTSGPRCSADADNAMTIAREEIFGPVLTVIPYPTKTTRSRIANDSDYGLAGSVWTDDTDRGLAIAARIRTGTFGVNQGYTMDPFAPFGGVKASGYGRELGREGTRRLPRHQVDRCGRRIIRQPIPQAAAAVGFDADSSEEPRWFDVADPAFGFQY